VSSYYADSATRFGNDVDLHVMDVRHNDGLYRHLGFSKSGNRSPYWFELVTWPGSLTIRGDMGAFTFARTDDMFGFFRTGRDINPGYWSEKLIATSGEKAYSEDVFKQHVTELAKVHAEGLDPEEAADFMKAVTAEVLESYESGHEPGARQAIEDFEHDGFRFCDAWEWDLSDWTFQFLWCCHAIRWGVAQFDRAAVSS
jgi:hypothetical protein